MVAKTPTAVEIRRRLEGRTQSLNQHLAAIRQEFAPMAEISGDGAPPDPKSTLSTEQKVGIALAATLAAGLLLGLKARKKKLGRAERMGATVRLYVDHLLDEAAQLAANGKDPGDALQKVLRRKPAVVQVERLDVPEERSVIANAAASVTKAALSFALKAGTDWVVSQLKKDDET